MANEPSLQNKITGKLCIHYPSTLGQNCEQIEQRLGKYTDARAVQDLST